TRCCIARSGERRSSLLRSGGWTERPRRGSPRRSLLIYHPCSAGGRKRELAPRHSGVYPDVAQDHRAFLAGALHDVHAVHQPVRPAHPDLRFAVGLLVPLRHEPDHVDRAPIRERVGPGVLRRVALTRLLDELSDQIGAGRAVLGDARADHLAWCGTRRIQPEEATVRHNAIALGRGEPHRKTTGAHLVQPATRGVGRPDHRIRDDLDEVSGKAGDRLVRRARAVENRPGVGALGAGQQRDREERGMRNAECGTYAEETDCCSAFRLPRSALFHAPTDAGSATRRPITSAITRTSRISCANWSGNRVCAPSDSACSGLGCTSTMMPSAPAATAARAIGITFSLRPVPCDGSAMIGRCDSLCTTGMAVRSNTLRVAVSNPRMPRSHRITSWFLSASTYSAERSSSSMVAAMPRFRSTAFFARPAALSSEEFCMLRAPIWMMSATSATYPTPSGSIASVQMSRPVSSRALASSLSPGRPSPWNA